MQPLDRLIAEQNSNQAVVHNEHGQTSWYPAVVAIAALGAITMTQPAAAVPTTTKNAVIRNAAAFNQSPSFDVTPTLGWTPITPGGHVATHAEAGHIDQAIVSRLSELRDIAAEEGISFSEASEADALWLFDHLTLAKQPSLFLSDTGNVRASWRHSLQRHASLEFLGGRRVQPVLFAHDDQFGVDSQLYGVVSLNAISGLLRATGLHEWILA